MYVYTVCILLLLLNICIKFSITTIQYRQSLQMLHNNSITLIIFAQYVSITIYKSLFVRVQQLLQYVNKTTRYCFRFHQLHFEQNNMSPHHKGPVRQTSSSGLIARLVGDKRRGIFRHVRFLR